MTSIEKVGLIWIIMGGLDVFYRLMKYGIENIPWVAFGLVLLGIVAFMFGGKKDN